MRANIIKGFYFLVFILFFGNNNVRGQVLLDIDLNPNGNIYDVAVDPNNNFYIVVGDFTQIGGVAANHIAFIDRTTMTVDVANTSNISVNAPIYAVEYYRVNVGNNAIGWTDFIFLGGEFTTGGGHIRVGLMRLEKKLSDLTYHGVNEDLGFTALIPNQPHTVYDLILNYDTLICMGNFAYNSPYTPQQTEYDIVAFRIIGDIDINDTIPKLDKISTMFNNQGSFMLSNPGSGCSITQHGDFKIKKGFIHNNEYYTLGIYTNCFPERAVIHKFDVNGNFIGLVYLINSSGNFIQFEPYTSYGFTKLDIADTTLICVSGYEANYDSIITHYTYLDGTPYIDASCSTTDPFINYDNVCDNDKDFSTVISYKKNNVYFIDKSTNNIGLYKFDFDNSPTPFVEKVIELRINTTIQNFYNVNMNIEDNKLFISKYGLFNVLTDNGGLAGIPTYFKNVHILPIFCLEPKDIPFFVAFDSLVCPGDTALYQLPYDEHTTGYIVEYTGTGIDIGANDAGSEDLSDTVNSTSFNIHVLNNFTPGELIIHPYSTCNDLTIDGIFAIGQKPIIGHIDYTNQPNIYVTADTTLNCFRDTVALHGYSDSVNVSYHWQNNLGGIGTVGQDTLSISSDFSISNPNGYIDYIFQVTDTISHCYNTDTVRVYYDTIKPNISIDTISSLNYDLTCVVDSVFIPFSSSTPNTIFFWSDGTDSTYTDTILATLPGSYIPYAKDTLNGCVNQSSFYVVNNITPPQDSIVGITTIPTTTPIDTITCYNDTVSYICSSPTPNTIAQWYDIDSVLTGNDTIVITSGNQYSFQVKDTVNGCVTNRTIIMAEFTTPPSVTMSTENVLNCSIDSIALSATTITIDTTFNWVDPNSNSYNNGSFYTSTTGWHYLTVSRNDNGCSYKDSIEVIFEPIINLIVNDTLICDSTSVDLSVGYVGNNITNPTYLWDNGQTSSITTYNSTTDTMAIINVLADNGCTGTDTIQINIPPRVQVTIDSYAPCDGWASGQLVVNVNQGKAPFTYAIDNSSFQSNAYFQNLLIGDYLISVNDSLGCLYNFSAEVTPNGLVPTPNFIFSTYNIQSDTIVLVDVSSPPTDTVIWNFPPEVTILDDSNSNAPVIILPDTGVFSIEMDAFYGTCNFNISKLIYSSEYDTTLANTYNQNGIKSVELYPNPNSGVFTVDIEFYKKQNAVTLVQDMTGYTYYYQATDESSLTFTHQIDLGANVQPGTYVLKVASEFDSFYITFVVAN